MNKNTITKLTEIQNYMTNLELLLNNTSEPPTDPNIDALIQNLRDDTNADISTLSNQFDTRFKALTSIPNIPNDVTESITDLYKTYAELTENYTRLEHRDSDRAKAITSLDKKCKKAFDDMEVRLNESAPQINAQQKPTTEVGSIRVKRMGEDLAALINRVDRIQVDVANNKIQIEGIELRLQEQGK